MDTVNLRRIKEITLKAVFTQTTNNSLLKKTTPPPPLHFIGTKKAAAADMVLCWPIRCMQMHLPGRLVCMYFAVFLLFTCRSLR